MWNDDRRRRRYGYDRPYHSEGVGLAVLGLGGVLLIAWGLSAAAASLPQLEVIAWNPDGLPTLPDIVRYAPAAAALAAVLLILFRVRRRRLVEDRMFGVQRSGVDTPALDHLAHIIEVCPGDHGLVLEVYAAHGVPTRVRPIRMANLSETPSQAQVAEAARRLPTQGA